MSRGQIQVEYDDNGQITRRFAVFELPDKSRIQGGMVHGDAGRL